MDPNPNPNLVPQITTTSTTTTAAAVSGKKKSKRSVCHKLIILLLSFIFFIFLFSLLTLFFVVFSYGFLAVLIDNFSSIQSPTSLASDCKIVSTGVDLRSSKVCELGLLNYKKHVFEPYDRTRFRCRYDYYWASIYKVEYTEHSSGQTRSALVESPKEALPLDCRPNFGTAWLNKDKFKVNETYNCWYTPGMSNVDILPDNLFNCEAKYPSMIEMIERLSIRLMKITDSWFSRKGRRTKRGAIQESVVGMVTGMSTSLIFIILIKVLQISIPRIVKIWDVRHLHLAAYSMYVKRACFLVVYFSVVGWLITQYGKMLGLPDLFISS